MPGFIKNEPKSRGIMSILRTGRERGIEIKPRQAKVIGIFSCKGGVGKTTTTANIGTFLADNMRGGVLAVDANLSAPNLGLHFGELNPRATIHDAIAGEIPVEKAITNCDGLPALLGSIAYGEEIHLVDLKSVIEPMKGKYRIILVDSAPGIGSEVIAAMRACDEMLIVTNPEVPTVASTLKTFRAAERYKIPILGTVVNKVWGEPYELPIKDVKKALGWPIVAVVPEDRKVRESSAAGVPVVRYDKNSPAAVKFRELGEFLIRHITKG